VAIPERRETLPLTVPVPVPAAQALAAVPAQVLVEDRALATALGPMPAKLPVPALVPVPGVLALAAFRVLVPVGAPALVASPIPQV